MAEYINRDEILRRLDECKGEPSELCYTYALYRSVEHIVRDIPAADVAEVKHGEWIDKPTGAYGRWQSWCSACGKHSGIGGITSNQHKPFCPNCGADMRG